MNTAPAAKFQGAGTSPRARRSEAVILQEDGLRLLRLFVGAFIASEASSGRYPRPVSMALSYLVARAGGLTAPIAFALLMRDMLGRREGAQPSARRGKRR